MLVYIIIALSIAFLTVINVFSSIRSDQKIIIWYIYFVLLVCFAGLRDGIGTDYAMYREMFVDINKAAEVESGFKLLLIGCKEIHIPAEMGLFSFSLITIYFAFKYIERYSSNPIFSLLIFFCFGQFYFNTFNTIRQSIVVYWFLSSIYLIENKNFTRFLFIILTLSFFFHLTALYLILIYFVCQYKFSKKVMVLILFGLYVFGNFMLKLVELSPYAVYSNFDFAQTKITSLQLIIFLFGLYLIFRPVKFNSLTMTRIFETLNFINCCLSILMISLSGSPVVLVMTRLLYYTTPIYIIIIPRMLDNIHLKSNKRVLTILVSVIFISIMFFSLMINGREYDMVPYRSILF